MTVIQYIQIGVGMVVSLGVFAGGIGYLMQSYKKSGRAERKDVSETADVIAEHWKAAAEELKAVILDKDAKYTLKIDDLTKDFNNKLQALTKEVGVLTGQLNAERTQNERLEKIFQGRNPEMEAFMKYMVTATEKHSETHEAMLQALKDLHGITTENNKILDARKKDVTIEGTMTTSK